MDRLLLLLACLIPAVALVAPPVAATTCFAEDAPALPTPLGDWYAVAATGPVSSRAGMHYTPIHFDIEPGVHWTVGASVELWEEHNRVPGLQRTATDCGGTDVMIGYFSHGAGMGAFS